MANESAQRLRVRTTLAWITGLGILAALPALPWFAARVSVAVVLSAISGAAAVVLLLYWPGRIIQDLLALRIFSGLGWRVLISLVLSLGVAPLLLDTIWRLTHTGWVILAVWWFVLGGLTLATRLRGAGPRTSEPGPPLFECRATRVFVLLVAVWLSACVIVTYWPGVRDGYPLAADPHDYIKHHAVLASLHRDGLPLGNVFCADAAHESYYYYHYFYLLPATLRLWTGGSIGIGPAFGMFAAAVALACVGLVYVLTKRVTGGEASATLAAAAVSLVGGLDVIPLALQRKLVVTLDAWADIPFRVHNFYTQYVWCPQHVHGLVILLSVVMLLSAAPRARWWFIVGPVLAASLVGSTVYLAVPALLSVLLYGFLGVLRQGPTAESRLRRFGGFAVVGLLSLVLMVPQLSGYLEMSRRYGETLTTAWPRNTWSLFGRLLPPGPWANLVDLPWLLLLEFGVRFVACLVVGRAVYRRFWADGGLRLLLIAAVVGIGLFTAMRSGVHRFDYGFKISVLAGMALSAMLCGCLVQATPARARPWNPLGWRLRNTYAGSRRRTIGALLVLTIIMGLPVGLYEAPGSAVKRFILPPGDTWETEKHAYRFLREELPADAVIQTDPFARRARMVQLASRQWGVLNPKDSDVGVFRAPDMQVVQRAYDDVQRAAQTDSAGKAHGWLQAHRVTHVFVGVEERERWAHLDKFEDGRYFTPVYRDEHVSVYALNPAPAPDS